MTFQRTASGISNYYLFFNVDCLIFVEGGEEQTTANQLNSPQNLCCCSEDISFWEIIFTCFIPNKKFKFISVGSKLNLLPIAERIATGDITNAIVAFDRDYDHIFTKKIISTNILYTYGYSWEADAICDEVIGSIFSVTHHISTNDACILVQKLKQNSKKLFRQLSRAIYLDILLSNHNDSFIPRNATGSGLLKTPSGKEPYIDIQKFQEYARLARAKHESLFSSNKETIDPHYDCYGHLLLTVYFSLFSFHSLQEKRKQKINRLNFINFIIASFKSAFISKRHPLYSYYKDVILNSIEV